MGGMAASDRGEGGRYSGGHGWRLKFGRVKRGEGWGNGEGPAEGVDKAGAMGWGWEKALKGKGVGV